MHEALFIQPLQLIVADVEMHELEAGLHFVIVAQLFDPIAFQIEPDQGLGDEGVVEPLQRVVRDVQPLEMVLHRQQAVQVLQPVVVQAQSLRT